LTLLHPVFSFSWVSFASSGVWPSEMTTLGSHTSEGHLEHEHEPEDKKKEDIHVQDALRTCGYPEVGNITFLMICFAVFDPSLLTLWINCSF